MKKALFIDIDGTLLEGFITIDFVNYLAKVDAITKKCFLDLSKISLDYKKGNISFEDWIQKWTLLWLAEMKGKDFAMFDSHAKTFFANYSKIYAFSKDLVSLFKSKGYILVGVSIGLSETANLVKEFIGLDYLFASTLETKGGKYTGRLLTNLHSSSGKKDAIISFCKENGVSLELSFACGDSIFDLPMFELTKYKVALNPDLALRSFAEKKGYLIPDPNNVINTIKEYLNVIKPV